MRSTAAFSFEGTAISGPGGLSKKISTKETSSSGSGCSYGAERPTDIVPSGRERPETGAKMDALR